MKYLTQNFLIDCFGSANSNATNKAIRKIIERPEIRSAVDYCVIVRQMLDEEK